MFPAGVPRVERNVSRLSSLNSIINRKIRVRPGAEGRRPEMNFLRFIESPLARNARRCERGSENISSFLHCDQIIGIKEENRLVLPEVVRASREVAP